MSDNYFENNPTGDKVFTIENNKLKFGNGSLQEIGYEAKYLNLKRVGLFTDQSLKDQPALETVKQALAQQQIEVEVYDQVFVEPTSKSFTEAIRFARSGHFDGFISLGGGSVIDTAKAANLYSTYPNDLLTYVNAPVGKAQPIPGPLKPHIACPTTFGTASECTPIAIFDYLPLKAKTGIVHAFLIPTLGILDPSSLYSLSNNVIAANGFDVFSHACESYTARPFTRRPAPQEPKRRPPTQGANPYSDVACLEAIHIIGDVLIPTIKGENREEGLEKLMLAGMLAGIGFGNAGCHVPHGMSYAVSGLVKNYRMEGWPTTHPLVPHGVSVIMNSPAVFRQFAHYCPERHLDVVKAIHGANFDLEDPLTPQQIGEALSNKIIGMLQATNMPNGLSDLGYSEADLDDLTQSAYPQKRVLDNAPKPTPITQDELKTIFKASLLLW